jgi:hypothetical protein
MRLAPGVVWMGAALAGVLGCDGGGGEAGPTGDQALTGRDFGNLFFWNGTPAFTRQSGVPNGPAQDLWIWPVGEASPLLALPQIDWSPPVWWGRIILGNLLMTGARGERIYDLNTRAATDLQRASTAGAATSSSPLGYTAIRRDGGVVIAYGLAGSKLLVGDGAAFTPMGPLVAKAADFMGTDLVVLGSPGDDWTADDGIYRIALPSGEISPLPVPPFDSDSSAANDTAPRCGPFATSPCGLFRVVGCSADDPPCAETGRAPCLILYERLDPEGANGPVLRPYAFDVATGNELALPGINPSDFAVSPDRHRVAWMLSYLDPQSGGDQGPAETDVYVHDFCAGSGGQCSLPHPVRMGWRSDSDLLTVELSAWMLGMVSLPDVRCGLLAEGTNAEAVVEHHFAPGNQHLAWHAVDRLSGADNGLWLGDAAGADPRRLAEGSIAFFSFSPDGQSIFITRSSGGQLSLGWLPIDGDAPVERRLADAYSSGFASGNRRALLIDRWNEQDASGTLELVDLTTGGRQVIARAVTDFATSGSVDGAAHMIYAVRGRFASGQDGLWQTTLPAP